MRPIKLTMSAFGPYAGEVCIEFDKLGRRDGHAPFQIRGG